MQNISPTITSLMKVSQNNLTLEKKILCTYNGNYRCIGDSSNQNWSTWSKREDRLTVDDINFEMWPDTSEYEEHELFKTGINDSNNNPSYLFSSMNPIVIERHFAWMLKYGIDGIWLKRFVTDLPGSINGYKKYLPNLLILNYVKNFAEKYDRFFSIMYDLTGVSSVGFSDVIKRDWSRLLNHQIHKTSSYVHENSKPVIMLSGLGHDKNLNPDVIINLITFLKSSAYVIGGVNWTWRTDTINQQTNPPWGDIYAMLDGICPLNTGNYYIASTGIWWCASGYWQEDVALARSRKQFYLPLIYPGYGVDNKNGTTNSRISRTNGNFMWHQFVQCVRFSINSAIIESFDDVTNGTAIFKISNNPPVLNKFITYGDLPEDHYLKLAGFSSEMIRTSWWQRWQSPVP